MEKQEICYYLKNISSKRICLCVRVCNLVIRTLISRNFCRKVMSVVALCTTTQCGKTRNSLPCKFFPSNQFIVKFFSKTLIWRNFCEKTVAVKFRNFHSVNSVHTYRKIKNLLSLKKYFVKAPLHNFFSRNVSFTKFLPKVCESKFCNFYTVISTQTSSLCLSK